MGHFCWWSPLGLVMAHCYTTACLRCHKNTQNCKHFVFTVLLEYLCVGQRSSLERFKMLEVNCRFTTWVNKHICSDVHTQFSFKSSFRPVLLYTFNIKHYKQVPQWYQMRVPNDSKSRERACNNDNHVPLLQSTVLLKAQKLRFRADTQFYTYPCAT